MTDARKTTLRRVLLGIDLVCILLMLLFIFGNSLLPKAESAAVSKTVLHKITSVIGTDNMLAVFLSLYIRKVAHFVEFSVLTVLVILCRLLLPVPYRKTLWPSLFFGLATAVTDEAIQFFTKRGSSVADVLLDFSAFLLWTLVTAVSLVTVKTILAYRAKRKEASPHVQSD